MVPDGYSKNIAKVIANSHCDDYWQSIMVVEKTFINQEKINAFERHLIKAEKQYVRLSP